MTMIFSNNHNEEIIAGAETSRLEQLATEYPWWGAVKMALYNRGRTTEGSLLYAVRMRERLAPALPKLKNINPDELKRNPTLGIIDDFLREGEHKITINEATTDEQLNSFAEESELEEEFVSEELAEIYAKQHLFDLAIEIYQKLSLQDSQKSIYFAELIERLNAERLKADNKK